MMKERRYKREEAIEISLLKNISGFQLSKKNIYIYTFKKQNHNIDILKGHREEHGPTNIAQELFNFWFSPSIETKNSKKCFNSFKSYFKN